MYSCYLPWTQSLPLWILCTTMSNPVTTQIPALWHVCPPTHASTHTPLLFWDQLCLVKDNLSCPFCTALSVFTVLFYVPNRRFRRSPCWLRDCSGPTLVSLSPEHKSVFRLPSRDPTSPIFQLQLALSLPPSLTPHAINSRAKGNTTEGPALREPPPSLTHLRTLMIVSHHNHDLKRRT